LRSYFALLFAGACRRCQSHFADSPDTPYRYRSFLNVSAADQAQVVAELANQEELYLAFFSSDCQCGELVSPP
jgi:hypothetical protein